MPMPNKNKSVRHEMPVQTRLASFQPTTYNAEQRTVELVWTTGADVRRYDWWNDRDYIERLSLEGDAVDLARLNGGAPLLNSHNMYDLGAQIGVVEKAWIENGEGRALVRFSSRDDVAPLLKDVQDGIIRNVSVGYQVSKYEISEEQGQDPVYTAVRWTPLEISLVTVPADPSANVRSAGGEEKRTCACDFINRAAAQTEESNNMPMPKDNAGGAPAADNPTQVDTRAIQDQAVRAERERANDIRAAARALAIDEEVVSQLINEGVSADVARQRMIDIHAEKSRAASIAATPSAAGDRPSGDDPHAIGRAMAEAIAARYSSKVKPSEQARQYMGHSVVDLAADLLRANGIKVETRNKARIIEMALSFRATGLHGTSDFSGVLLDASNKLMLGEYGQQTATYQKIAAKKVFNDFKPHNFIRLGDFPTPVQVGESGEIKYGALKDSKELVSLLTYARIIGISRQALINDDLGAFGDLSMKIGRRILDFENMTAFALIKQNSGCGPAMSDTVNMFDSAHGNKAASNSAIDVANVGIGIAAMMAQTGLADPKDKRSAGIKLNLRPKYLLNAPEKIVTAAQVCTPIMPTASSAVNPFAGTLEALSDANLSGNGWYLFADPANAECLVYGHLEGQEGPRVESRNGFETDGVELKIVDDFAAGVVDYKGAFFNAGA